MLRPSEIYVKALKLQPDVMLPKWASEHSATCSHCAIEIKPGEHYSPVTLGAFFSDSRDLAAPNAIVCWRCVILRTKTMLNNLSYTVTTEEGVFSISKDVEKAWLFMNPPPAPFVAVHSSSTMQHLAWRTPVTIDNRLIFIRYGANLFTVRPEYIRRAVAIAKRVMEQNGGKWVTPLLLDRDLEAPFHGILNPKAAEFLSEEEREFFLNLGAGDRWALSTVMHSKLPEPGEPVSLTEKINEKLKG
ncbi:type IV CRISPR-associated protein Csf1 [Pseudomonas aeruginosa]